MNLYEPGTPEYVDTTTLNNAMIDRRPALVARCATPADVTEAIAYARSHGLALAVRAGGHSVAGLSLVDDGLVIDVRDMYAVEVDAERRVARVGAGATWSQFDRATQPHGLATTGGRVSTTGVAGLTLGGGSGWLERKHGLACDNLLAVELVTADGEHVRASAAEHPDLFWALRGGGGNFGVVTAFEFQLHPVGRRGARRPRAVARRARARAARALPRRDARRAGGPQPGLPVPQGPRPRRASRSTCTASWSWPSPACTRARSTRAARRCARSAPPAPEVDFFGPMPYADFQCMIDDPPGYRNYWTSEHLADLPDEAIEAIASRSEAMPPGSSQLFMVSWGGAVARVGQDASPLSARDARFVVHPFGMWEDPADDAANIEWARGFRDDLAAFSTGAVYLNFVGDEGEARVRAGYGAASYERLAWIKAVWDPDNVFRASGNVPPPTAVARAA